MKILLLLLSIQLNCLNIDNQKPTLSSVYSYMLEKEILYPDIHLQIIIVETGWLKKINKKNNLCNWRGGDKKKYKHDSEGYILFQNSWKESIDYLKDWQDRNYCNRYLSNHKPTDYWDFIHWIGWVDGKSYSTRGKRYIEYCKKIKINL